jgi:trimeric autotransporter adhesin
MIRKLFTTLALVAMPLIASAQLSDNGKPVKPVLDADMTGITVWHSDTVYNIKEGIYVDSGEVLIIQPGTIIKTDTGTLSNAKYLFVSRGGKLYAEGTPCAPIIFTTINDDLDLPNDIPFTAASKGQWGGVVLAGYASINLPAGFGNAEGITPTPRTLYGGTNDDDNSGVLRYVSIRYPGIALSANNEINGMTFYGVGRQTRVDHIEVFWSADDDYEWFGGTVNCSYLVGAFGDDDCFDVDQGYRGQCQFLFQIKHPDWGDRLTEVDGANAAPWTDLPNGSPIFANVTSIGSGAVGAAVGNPMLIRENVSGAWFSSIFTDAKNANIISIQTFPAGTASSLNNYISPDGAAGDPWVGQGPYQGDTLFFRNNFLFQFNGGAGTLQPEVLARVAGDNLQFNVNPQLNSISRVEFSSSLDPRPSGAGPAASGAPAPIVNDGYIDTVSYFGAFDPNAGLWTDEWTALSFYRYTVSGSVLANCDCATDGPTGGEKPVKVITDAFDVERTTYWHSDTVYRLTEGVYVDTTHALIVAPGTIIKADSGTLSNAKYLFIVRGAKAFFNGAKCCPIIMTAIADDVDDPSDIPFTAASKGQWGGLVLAGTARINLPAGFGNAEGITPTTRTLYGGTNDDDNSGSYQFVSIRYPGIALSANNEINGVTFYGVGRQTRVNNIEVFMSADDDYEWFGGTVNTRYLVGGFGDDDCFDIDQGYRGSNQFLFQVKHPDWGDRLTECDGANAAPWTDAPAAYATFANVTAIGSGNVGAAVGNPMLIRENVGGEWINSIYTDAKNASVISIQTFPAGTESALNNYILPDGSVGDPWAGQGAFTPLYWRGNFFHKFAGAAGTLQAEVNARLAADVNSFNVDPQIRNIDRTQNNALDPRLKVGSPALVGAVAPVSDPLGWIQPVSYRGAFSSTVDIDSLWLSGWTFLDCGEFIGTNYSVSCCDVEGDANNSGTVNVVDLTFLVARLFQGGPAPACNDEADVNDSGTINVVDLTYLVARLFQGGPITPCP